MFAEAFSEVSRGVKKFKQNQYDETGSHPIIDQGQELIAGYSDEEQGLFTNVPAIVFGDHTRCVKYVDEPFFAGADGVKILKPKLSGNTRFWWHALKATPIENLGYSRHFKLLKAATFRLYDERHQTEIVTALDSVLEGIDQVNQQIAQLDQLVKSRFVEMFGDPSIESSAHMRVAIGSFAEVQTGATPSRKEPKFYGGSILWVKTGEVARNFANGIEETISDLAIEKTNCKVFPTNTVLVAMYGQGDTRGKTAILPCDAATNQACAAILPSEKHDPAFLNTQLQLMYEDLRAKSLGGTQQNLSLRIVKAMKVFLPPFPLQQDFAVFAAQVDKTRAIAKQQVDKLQTLYDSLAQDYFS